MSGVERIYSLNLIDFPVILYRDLREGEGRYPFSSAVLRDAERTQ